jgi:DNA repair photolyase
MQNYSPTGSSIRILSKKGKETSVKIDPIIPTNIDSQARNKKHPAGKLNCNLITTNKKG